MLLEGIELKSIKKQKDTVELLDFTVFFVSFSSIKKTISIAEYEVILVEKDAKISELQFRLEKLERMLFGAKRERFVYDSVSAEQLNMFAAVE